MPKISIIDDKLDIRTTLKKKIKIYLKKHSLNWDVIDSYPLEHLEDYLAWITDEEISIIVLDERLHVGKEKNKKAVEYNGHDLAKYIRQTNKEIPIFAISSYDKDSALKKEFSEFEDIIKRSEFSSKTDGYMKKIIRSGQRYLEQYEKELLNLSKLSEIVAKGKASSSEKKQLNLLQTKLELPVQIAYTSTENIIKEFEKDIDELRKMKKDIQAELKKK